MAPSFDCAMSSLLCAEDNNDIFNEFDITNNNYNNNNNNNNHGESVWFHQIEIKDFNELVVQSDDESLSFMLESETQHLPCADYLKRLQSGDLDFDARKQAIDWMIKVHAHYGFQPLCEYLAINYFDRFLSAYELPKGKAWMMQLLAVASLSIASKMEETEVPLSLDLQVCGAKFVFEAKTIQTMELLILTTLSWRMQSVTPFSFLDHFLRAIDDEQKPLRPMILRSIQLISSIIKGINFLEYRPSEIAAAVTLSVLGETKIVDTEKAISALKHVEKERVLKCIEMLRDSGVVNKGDATSLVLPMPESPIGVLDAACLSYKSEDTTVESCANSSHDNTPVAKRRKLDSTACEVRM
ncbi:hypothetical protein ACFE04_025800 [Oxalis oulophora]